MATIDANIFESACINQLGKIDPFAFFSFMYPITNAINPVKNIIIIVFITPAVLKNIIPCNKPNITLCITFAVK